MLRTIKQDKLQTVIYLILLIKYWNLNQSVFCNSGLVWIFALFSIMDPNCLVTLLLYPKLFYGVDVDAMKMDGEKVGRCLFWFLFFLGVFYTACQESQKEFQHNLSRHS